MVTRAGVVIPACPGAGRVRCRVSLGPRGSSRTALEERPAGERPRVREPSGIARWWRGTGTPAQRKALVAILAVALSLRVVWCVYAADIPVVGDPAQYHIQAVQIARGEGYNSATVYWQRIARAVVSRSNAVPGHDVPTAIGPPGYPATLGALFWLVIHSPLPDNFVAAAVALNVALGVATILMAFEIMRRLFDTRVALVAAAVLAVYPNLVFHTATLHWETTFIFVAMAALLVLLGRPWPGGRVPNRRLLAFAALFGCSVLIRPIAWPMVLLLALAARLEGSSLRRALAQCGIVVAVVGLIVLPWTIRNIVKLHSPVVISTGYGAALCMARHPGASGGNSVLESAAARENMRRYCVPPTKGIAPEDQEVRENDYAMSQAITFVVHNPAREVRQWPTRIRLAYRDDHDALEDVGPFIAPGTGTTLAKVGDWFFFVTLGLAAVGVSRSAGRRTGRHWFLLLTAASLASTPILLYGAPRYKVPATPLIAMIAAVGLVSLADRVTGTPADSTPRTRPQDSFDGPAGVAGKSGDRSTSSP